MRKLLIIVRDREDTNRNYIPFWDYIKSIDNKYSHCIDYVVLVSTNKTIPEVTSELRNLYNNKLIFIVVDVTQSEHDGWTAKSFWDKWNNIES